MSMVGVEVTGQSWALLGPCRHTYSVHVLGGSRAWGDGIPPRPADQSLSSCPCRPFTAEIYRQKSSQIHKRS